MELEEKICEIVKGNSGNFGIVIKGLKTCNEIKINEHRAFMSASIIKLFIMGETLRQVKEGKHLLNEKIIVNKEMQVGGDGILKELNGIHEFNLEELITLMIIVSDNEAANILIDIIGFSEINKFIKDSGLRNTVINRKMMDFEALKKGIDNYTSAFDVSKFYEKLHKKEVIDEKYSNLMLNILERQHICGALDIYLPEGNIIAHKTGNLYKLEHDAGIIYKENEPYIICVLADKLKTNYKGREIIGKISKLVFDEFK